MKEAVIDTEAAVTDGIEAVAMVDIEAVVMINTEAAVAVIQNIIVHQEAMIKVEGKMMITEQEGEEMNMIQKMRGMEIKLS